MQNILTLYPNSPREAAAEAPARPVPTTIISSFLLLLGLTRLISDFLRVHFSDKGPSGIFDTDLFYDLVYEEPLDNLYEIANVITIFDSNMKSEDETTRFLLGNQLASCGIVIASKAKGKKKEDIVDYLNGVMKDIQCSRVFKDDIILYDNNPFS